MPGFVTAESRPRISTPGIVVRPPCASARFSPAPAAAAGRSVNPIVTALLINGSAIIAGIDAARPFWT